MAFGSVPELIKRGYELGASKPLKDETDSDIRNDSLLFQLRDSIAKLEGAGVIKDELWDEIVTGATNLLQRSSDVQVASYLCLALFRRDHYPGLLVGLSCLRTVLEHNDGAVRKGGELSGKVLRRRILALEWVGNRLTRGFKSIPPTPEDAEFVEAAIQISSSLPLDTTAEPIWRTTINNLGELRKAAQSPLPTREANSQALPDEQIRLSESDLPEDSAAAWKAIKGAAANIWRKNPTVVWPYKILRIAEWAGVQNHPEIRKDDRTLISPPPRSTRDQLRAAQNGSDWRLLVEDAEKEFQNYPLWLDLQRLSHLALLKLGQEYRYAAQAVHDETVELLARLPDLAWYKFSDGTPFADEATNLWLVERSGPVASLESPRGPERQLHKPFDLATQGQGQSLTLEECLDAFTASVQRLGSANEAFHFRFEFAKHCERVGERKMAIAQFYILDQLSRTHGLDSWDPVLCADLLQWGWKLLSKANSKEISPKFAKLSDQLYTRLSKLDPAKALSLDGKLHR